MARVNGIETGRAVGNPQQAQSVNVGQFGPSYDSLQDWRSVFTAAAEVRKIAADLSGTDEEIKGLIIQAEQAVDTATQTAAYAQQINEDTIENVEVRWQQIQKARDEVESDRVEVAGNSSMASSAAILSQSEASASAASANDSRQLKEQMEDIRNDVTHLTVSVTSIDHAAPAEAVFNQHTNHLQLKIPKIEQQGESAVFTVNGQSGNVTLTATDVGAVPNEGDIYFRNKISFPADGTNEFEIDGKVNGSEYELTLLHNGSPRKGLVIDGEGNGAFGGRLYVNNLESADKKEVFHEGRLPTASQLNVYSKTETYSQDEVSALFRSKVDSYNQAEVRNLVAAKVELNNNDGQIYARQNASWVNIGRTIDALTTRITALEAKLAGNLRVQGSIEATGNITAYSA